MLKRILPWLVAISLIALFSLLIFTPKVPPVQSFRKPDGTIVTFIEAAYGSNQSVVWGKSIQRSLYKMLPKRLKTWSGALVHTYTTSQTNIPTFWLHETNPRPNNPSLPVKKPGEYLHVRVLDEFGCEYDSERSFMGGQYFGRNGSIYFYQLNPGDPCGKIAGICVYDSNAKAQCLASFLIPGTVLTPPPTGTQPLALPKHDGEFTFQLISLATGLKSAPFAYAKRSNSVLFSQAIFRTTTGGAPDPSWFPTTLNVSDARGSVIKIGVPGRGFRDGDAVLNFEGVLDPAAGPFKLRVEFMHKSIFSPDELIKFKDVSFPAVSESVFLKLEMAVQGRRLILDSIDGAHVLRPANFFHAKQPVIVARLEPATNSFHLQLVRALDESGTEIQLAGSVATSEGDYEFGLAPSAKAKTMTLTFAVLQSRFIEFEATPIWFRTNNLAGH